MKKNCDSEKNRSRDFDLSVSVSRPDVFFAVRVVAKESSRSVLRRTPYLFLRVAFVLLKRDFKKRTTPHLEKNHCHFQRMPQIRDTNVKLSLGLSKYNY